LAVLVHLYEKPRHPYELATTMRERGKEKSIRLNYGSLYTVIEALERDGYIRNIETKREGRRPVKTVYKITKSGEGYMMYWMRDLVGTPEKEFLQFEAALSLLPVLPPDEVIPLLENRLVLLKRVIDNFKDEKRLIAEIKLPRLFVIETEFYEEMTKAEYRFVEALVKDIKNDVDGIESAWTKMHKSVLGKRHPAHGTKRQNRLKGVRQ